MGEAADGKPQSPSTHQCDRADTRGPGRAL